MGSDQSYIDPRTDRPGCPECDGYGYHDSGDYPECETCNGAGVADQEAAEWYIERARRGFDDAAS